MIGIGITIGIYISSQIDKHISKGIGLKEFKDKVEKKDMSIKDITHYYTYIKKEEDDN